MKLKALLSEILICAGMLAIFTMPVWIGPVAKFLGL